jgi:hypothetical protein
VCALRPSARALSRFTESTYLMATSARGWRRVEPLGPPEQPRAVLAFLESVAGLRVRNRLQARVVDAIAAAA